jgi:hypothetical protein
MLIQMRFYIKAKLCGNLGDIALDKSINEIMIKDKE